MIEYEKTYIFKICTTFERIPNSYVIFSSGKLLETKFSIPIENEVADEIKRTSFYMDLSYNP